MADILHLVKVNAPVNEIFTALSEQRGLAGWWTENVQAEPTVGSIARFRFGNDGGNDMQILALEPNRLVRWRCVGHLSGDEWIGTELTFELRPRPTGTEIVFSHRGWPAASDFLRSCSVRWALYLVSLKNFVESGRGSPWPHDVQS